MQPSLRRRLRFWLIAPLGLLVTLFGFSAVNGQFRPAGSGPSAPGFPNNNPGNKPGFPNNNPGNNLPGFPNNNPGNILPGFPNNPGNNLPSFPNNPGNPGGNSAFQRTCTCSNCKGTFAIGPNETPTSCKLCGAKFDRVDNVPGPGAGPSFPGLGPNVPTMPGGGAGPPPGMPAPMTPGGGNFPGSMPNAPSMPGGMPNNNPSLPLNSDPTLTSSTSSKTASGIGTAFMIVAGVGVLVLGLVLIGGVVACIFIFRSVESSASSGPRRRPRRRNYDD